MSHAREYESARGKQASVVVNERSRPNGEYSARVSLSGRLFGANGRRSASRVSPVNSRGGVNLRALPRDRGAAAPWKG